MSLHVFTWLRRLVRRHKPLRYASVAKAIAALRKHGIAVRPYDNGFQCWQMGDFIMGDADVIRYAISMGLIDR